MCICSRIPFAKSIFTVTDPRYFQTTVVNHYDVMYDIIYTRFYVRIIEKLAFVAFLHVQPHHFLKLRLSIEIKLCNVKSTLTESRYWQYYFRYRSEYVYG